MIYLKSCNVWNVMHNERTDVIVFFFGFAVLSVEVELLIYAHDCHTLACNMEGISAVLRAAQSLVELLHTAEEYNLMVRKINFKKNCCRGEQTQPLCLGIGRTCDLNISFKKLSDRNKNNCTLIRCRPKLAIKISFFLSQYVSNFQFLANKVCKLFSST